MSRQPSHVGPRQHAARAAMMIVAVLAIAACGSSNNNSTGGSGSGSGSGSGGAVTKTGTIDIGIDQSMTGSFSGLATVSTGGLQVAINAVNSSGGIVIGDTRYTLNPIIVDAQSTPAGANAATTQLIRDNNIKFLFGPAEATEAAAAIPLAAASKVIQFTGSSAFGDMMEAGGAGPGKTPNSTYEFIVVTSTKGLVAEHVGALKTLLPGAKTAAVLFQNNATTDAQVQDIRDGAQSSLGITIPDGNVFRYDPTATDFTAILTHIKQIHPDILFTGTSATSVAAIVKQMGDLGNVAGAVDVWSGKLATPPAFPYAYANLGAVDPGNPPAAWTRMLSDYQALKGGPPAASVVTYTGIFYGPLLALVEAMKEAHTVTDTDAIAAQLLKVKLTDTPMGPLSFTPNHTAAVSQVICKVDGSNQTCQTAPYNTSSP